MQLKVKVSLTTVRFECDEEDALETHKELFHENEKPEVLDNSNCVN